MRRYKNFVISLAFLVSLLMMTAVPYGLYADVGKESKTVRTDTVEIPVPSFVPITEPVAVVSESNSVKEVVVKEVFVPVVSPPDTVFLSSKYSKLLNINVERYLKVPDVTVINRHMQYVDDNVTNIQDDRYLSLN